MEHIVLAGPIQFSPADIALILAALAASYVALTAPGWLVLATAAGRRVPADAPPGQRWSARVAGALGGLALSGVVYTITWALLDHVMDEIILPVGTVAAWVGCFVLARALRRPGPAAPARRETGSAPEGWGR